MVQGQCPHPWNKTKKGTFQRGHEQVNYGRGQFEEGHTLPKEVCSLNKKLGQERYKEGNHPFCKINELSQLTKNPNHYFYGIHSRDWVKISKRIKERDNWICQNPKCKIDLHGRKSNCHHMIPYSWTQDNRDENLITYCIPCHGKIERFTRKLLLSFGWEVFPNFSQSEELLNIRTE